MILSACLFFCVYLFLKNLDDVFHRDAGEIEEKP